MEFLSDYVLFLAKTVTVVLALAALLVVAMLSRRHASEAPRGQIQITDLSEQYRQVKDRVRDALLDARGRKAEHKARKLAEKAEAKAAKKAEPSPAKPRCFVLNFKGDMSASAVDCLREEITAVLSAASPEDEVLLRLESPGGVVHGYGLAASQLTRLKAKGIKLTVAVDKVAASGGYMMACVADTIVAAPFAVLGSIGVVAQIPNLHRLLKKHEVDIELHTAGEHKRTLTLLGENTEAGREKFREELEQTHQLFKQFVAQQRPALDIARVATGEHWFGTQAKTLGLIDVIATSDELLLERAERMALFEIHYELHKSLAERFHLRLEQSGARLGERFMERWLNAARTPRL